MAVVLVLQSSVATTWPRALERAVGSVLGGALAALLGLVLHSPLALTAAVFPLAIATMAVRPVNYGLFVFFLTPLFVLVIELSQPGVERAGPGLDAGALQRAGQRHRRARRPAAVAEPRGPAAPRPALAAAIEANGRYAALAFAPNRRGRDRSRPPRRRTGQRQCRGGAWPDPAGGLVAARRAGRRAEHRHPGAPARAGAAAAAWLHRPDAGPTTRHLGNGLASRPRLWPRRRAAAPPCPPARRCRTARARIPERLRLLQEVLLLRAAAEHLVPV